MPKEYSDPAWDPGESSVQRPITYLDICSIELDGSGGVSDSVTICLEFDICLGSRKYDETSANGERDQELTWALLA